MGEGVINSFGIFSMSYYIEAPYSAFTQFLALCSATKANNYIFTHKTTITAKRINVYLRILVLSSPMIGLAIILQVIFIQQSSSSPGATKVWLFVSWLSRFEVSFPFCMFYFCDSFACKLFDFEVFYQFFFYLQVFHQLAHFRYRLEVNKGKKSVHVAQNFFFSNFLGTTHLCVWYTM